MNSSFSVNIVREKNLDTNVCCYMRVCICMHISPELSLLRAWEQQTSVPMSITRVQDVVSEYCSLLKDTRAFWRHD